MEKLGIKIAWLIGSIVVIWAGLSGSYVFRGTDSGVPLVVLGSISLVAYIISIATHGKSKRKLEQRKEQALRAAEQFTAEILAEPQPEPLAETHKYLLTLTPKNLINHEQYLVYFNGEALGPIFTAQKKMTLSTQRKRNVICAINEKNGEQTHLFFEVLDTPGTNAGFLLQRGSLACFQPEKNGLKILSLPQTDLPAT